MKTDSTTPTRDSSSPRRASPWSLTIATVSGIPIRLHFTFLILLAWVGVASMARGGASQMNGLFYALALFASVGLHELGHSLVAVRYGIPVSEIVLYPIGGVARIEKAPTPRQELWIALAGPAVNLAIAAAILLVTGVGAGLAGWYDRSPATAGYWQNVAQANLALFAFNMVPAFPMDGGRVLRSLLALRMGGARATEIAARIGQWLAVAMALAALVSGNITLLFIAFFVFVGAGQESTMHQTQSLMEGQIARAAMLREFRTLPAGASLRAAGELLLCTSQQDFPIVSGETAVGLLTREDLMAGLLRLGPDAYVTEVMNRGFCSASPDDPLDEMASTLGAERCSSVLILQEGQLIGMVTRDNLIEYTVLRRIAREWSRRRPVAFED